MLRVRRVWDTISSLTTSLIVSVEIGDSFTIHAYILCDIYVRMIG